MALANCSKCGSLFNKVVREICDSCFQEEEEMLKETQDYLRDNRSAAMWEILEAVEDLNQALLDKWIDQGRVTVVDPIEEASKKRCMYCGREVKGAGNICKTCEIKKTLSSAKKPASTLDQPKKEDTDKAKRSGMHFKR